MKASVLLYLALVVLCIALAVVMLMNYANAQGLPMCAAFAGTDGQVYSLCGNAMAMPSDSPTVTVTAIPTPTP